MCTIQRKLKRILKLPLHDREVPLRTLAQELGCSLTSTYRGEKHLEDEALYATDMVYYLVNKGVAFKEAHSIIGTLVRHAIDSSITIESMPDAELAKFSKKLIHKEIVRLFDPKVSVGSKKSIKRG